MPHLLECHKIWNPTLAPKRAAGFVVYDTQLDSRFVSATPSVLTGLNELKNASKLATRYDKTRQTKDRNYNCFNNHRWECGGRSVKIAAHVLCKDLDQPLQIDQVGFFVGVPLHDQSGRDLGCLAVLNSHAAVASKGIAISQLADLGRTISRSLPAWRAAQARFAA